MIKQFKMTLKNKFDSNEIKFYWVNCFNTESAIFITEYFYPMYEIIEIEQTYPV